MLRVLQGQLTKLMSLGKPQEQADIFGKTVWLTHTSGEVARLD